MILMLPWLDTWTSCSPAEIMLLKDATSWRGGSTCFPSGPKGGRKRLVRARGAVEFWEKFDVPDSRWPLAWEKVAATSCVLSWMGELDAAVY